MRMLLLPLAAAVILAAPADAATRNFGIESFTKVRIEGPFKVRLTTGVPPSASASGSPAAIQRVAIEMRGDTLLVHPSSSSWGGYPGQDPGPVEVDIGTHDLSSAWLSGSGSIAIDKVKGLSFDLSVQGSGAASIGATQVDQLSVAVVGTGSAALAGQAGKLTAVVRGVSSLDAAALSTKDATIGAEGTATVAADITDSVKIDGSGPVTIRLSGNPACTVKVSGSATVSGCRSTQ